MTDQERLHEAVIEDLEQTTQRVIAMPRNDYLLGNLHGRLIAFALSGVISKDEFDRFHDRLEESGVESIRLRVVELSP